MAIDKQEYQNVTASMYATGTIRAGQRKTIPNREITELSFWLERIGNPPGNVSYCIWRVSDGALLFSEVWGAAMALQLAGQMENLVLATPVTIDDEVIIGVAYNDGNAPNRIALGHINAERKTGEYRAWYSIAGGWQYSVTDDVTYIYTYPDPITGDFVENGGFERGEFSGGWVRNPAGAAGIPNVMHAPVANPRTGVYSTRFYTAGAGITWGQLVYTLVNPLRIAYLRGKTVDLNCWTRQETIFAGGPGSFWYVQLSENGDGNLDTTGNLYGGPFATYINRQLSVPVGLTATNVQIDIYWYKSGGGSIYEVDIDDVSLEVDGQTGLYLPTAQTLPATEVT